MVSEAKMTNMRVSAPQTGDGGPAAFQATYSDWRLVRSRKVVQVVLELPIEDADSAYAVLGGMPNPGSEIWVGVARLDPKGGDTHSAELRHNNTPPASVSSPPKPARAHRSWHDMTPAAQAGVLCGDMSFQKFLGVTNPAYAALEVRNRCHITSRADLNRNIDAATIWRGLVSDYRAFMREPEVIG